MEENKKKSPKLVILVIIGLVLIILLGVQVYASVKGYGNIFFMIKDLSTTKDAYGVDEILINDEETVLSDKDIKEVDEKSVTDSHSNEKSDTDNLSSNKIKTKTDNSFGKKIYEKAVFSNIFFYQVLEVKDFDKSEFLDEEIVKLLPFIDEGKEENKTFNSVNSNDGDFANATIENVQKLSKKYFEKELDIDNLEEKKNNRISVEMPSGFGIRVFEFKNCYELEDGSYLLEIEEIDESSSGSLVYGLIVEYSESTDTIVYKGVTSSVIDLLSEYSEQTNMSTELAYDILNKYKTENLSDANWYIGKVKLIAHGDNNTYWVSYEEKNLDGHEEVVGAIIEYKNGKWITQLPGFTDISDEEISKYNFVNY